MKYDLHDSLGYKLTYAARLNERRFERALAEIGLTRLIWCVLCALSYQGLSRPSEIAEYIGVDRTAISRALTRMDKAAMISRASDPDGDGRARMIVITETGATALSSATVAAKENAAFWADKLTGGDRIALRRALDELIENADEPLQGL
ncbi:MAG: MarR family winged helix-turn-helix transcriptional regulator [Pikeienuella sp.]